MAKLDRFLSALSEYRAEALVLTQDQTPAFRFLSGTKSVSKQVLDGERLIALIRELAPPSALSEYQQAGTSSFVYQLDGTTYSGTLEVDAGNVVATIWEATHAVSDDMGPSSRSVTPITDEGFNPGPQAHAAAAVPKENVISTMTTQASPKGGQMPEGEIHLPSLDDHTIDDLIPDDLPPNYREKMEDLLRLMIDRGASDLHICCRHRPYLRVDGVMQAEDSYPMLEADELFRMLFSIAPRRNRDEFLKSKDTDCAYAIEGLSRYRCNFFFDRHGPGAVFRAVPNEITPAAELGLPQHVQDLAKLHKGLVLVTGPTGSGKSTTLAALLDIVNSTRSDHIITIEDPIEFVHPPKRCLVNQREVGVHTNGFQEALRASLREDPDVVLVGELRDLETVAMAIETAETGHLVFGTLHTTSAASTVDRVIDQFPPEQQAQVRVMLSESLRAVISQTLCKRKVGGRVAALEILMVQHSISNLIREGKTFQIESSMQTGKQHGMQTLNDHLMRLVQEDQIDAEEAHLKSVNKKGLREAFERNGIQLD